MAGRRLSDRSLRAKAASPGSARDSASGGSKAVLGVIAVGDVERRRCDGLGVSQAVGTRWFRDAGGMPPSTLARSSKPMSGRYLSFESARRSRCACAGAGGAGGRASARTSAVDDLAGVAAQRGDAKRRARVPGDDGAMARGAGGAAAEGAKLATNAVLRAYVQDRLAGTVAAPGGTMVAGPSVAWKGRRHGRRGPRRWARAWSPEQIAERLRLGFPDDGAMRISHEAIYQALYVQGRGALRRELTACLRTGRALRVPRARTRGRGK